MTNPPHPEEVELDKLIDKFTFTSTSGQIVFWDDHIYPINKFKTELSRWREAYAEKLVKEAYKKGYVDGGINK